jgi:hypothetical protein
MRPLKILPCPEHSGKHPLHDCRYIATIDTDVHVNEVPVTNQFGDKLQPDRSDWQLLNGRIIAKMTDDEYQREYAALFANSPWLLELLRAAVGWYRLETCNHYIEQPPVWYVDAVCLLEKLPRRAG